MYYPCNVFVLLFHQRSNILVHLPCLLIVNFVQSELLNDQDAARDFARFMLTEVNSPERALIAEFAYLEYLVEVHMHICQAARILQ